jgi:hypothetical protein
MWKNIVERGRPHDNMMHAHCILDALGYKLEQSGCLAALYHMQEHWG